MKKLKLNLRQLENAEVLTRSQLKNVLGGDAVSSTYTKCGTNISCSGKAEFEACGSSGNCGCGWVSGSLYCRMDS